MKSIVCIAALIGALVANASAEDGCLRSISVSGTVETKTAPDIVVWRISLTNTDKGLGVAKSANDEDTRAVLALREKLGIAQGDIETGQISIRREYERDERGRQGAFKHFVVDRSITIRQRELDRFDEFLDALIASADMEVDFSFQSSKIHEIRAATRLKALMAARDKASAMAEAVGARLGKVITINEHSENQRYTAPWSNAAVVHSSPGVDQASDTFIPGAIPVTVTVYAVFELE